MLTQRFVNAQSPSVDVHTAHLHSDVVACANAFKINPRFPFSVKIGLQNGDFARDILRNLENNQCGQGDLQLKRVGANVDGFGNGDYARYILRNLDNIQRWQGDLQLKRVGANVGGDGTA